MIDTCDLILGFPIDSNNVKLKKDNKNDESNLINLIVKKQTTP